MADVCLFHYVYGNSVSGISVIAVIVVAVDYVYFHFGKTVLISIVAASTRFMQGQR